RIPKPAAQVPMLKSAIASQTCRISDLRSKSLFPGLLLPRTGATALATITSGKARPPMAEDLAYAALDAQPRWWEPAPHTVFGTPNLWQESNVAMSRSPGREINFADEERFQPSLRFQ